MKAYKFIILGLATLFAASCSQKLPYDLEGVEKGVVMNIAKSAGSGASMNPDMSTVFNIELSIPWQQGDYSMLKEAKILAIYTKMDGTNYSGYIAESITEFPCKVSKTSAEVCTALGVKALDPTSATPIEIGDRVQFTYSYVLNSGTVVEGWTPITGFNNNYYSSWMNDDGTAVNNRISFTAFAVYHKSDFIGTFILDDGYDTPCVVAAIDEPLDESLIPAGLTAADFDAFSVTGAIYGLESDCIKFWVNLEDYSIIVPFQKFSDYDIGQGFAPGLYIEESEGELDLNNKTILISASYVGLCLPNDLTSCAAGWGSMDFFFFKD